VPIVMNMRWDGVTREEYEEARDQFEQALKKGDDKTAALPADPADAAATHDFARYCIAFADAA